MKEFAVFVNGESFSGRGFPQALTPCEGLGFIRVDPAARLCMRRFGGFLRLSMSRVMLTCSS